MASINIDFHRLLKVFGIQDEAALKALENLSETAMISELCANAKGIIPFVLASDESFTVILHVMKRTPTTATDITGSLQTGKIEQPVGAWQKHTQVSVSLYGIIFGSDCSLDIPTQIIQIICQGRFDDW